MRRNEAGPGDMWVTLSQSEDQGGLEWGSGAKGLVHGYCPLLVSGRQVLQRPREGSSQESRGALGRGRSS